jgi:FkbM family methyltransferase
MFSVRELVEMSVERYTRHNPLLHPKSLDGAVLFGTAVMGRRFLGFFRRAGLTVSAFADNNRALWGSRVEGVPVIDPATLAAKPYQVVIITSGYVREILAQCRSLGLQRVVPHFVLSTLWPEAFPNEQYTGSMESIADGLEDIDRLRSAWADETSRQLFDRLVRFRATLDINQVPPSTVESYFLPDLYPTSAFNVFVDCGAYDGDTLRELVKHTDGAFQQYIGFEPDPVSYPRLQGAIPPALAAKCRIYNAAVGDRAGTLRFESTAGLDSRISEQGGQVVQVVTLDSALAGQPVTMIKMDLEGFERPALLGASETIRACKPNLAVCVYHLPADLWELPLLILQLNPSYRLYLRLQDPREMLQTVCFAVAP